MARHKPLPRAQRIAEQLRFAEHRAHPETQQNRGQHGTKKQPRKHHPRHRFRLAGSDGRDAHTRSAEAH